MDRDLLSHDFAERRDVVEAPILGRKSLNLAPNRVVEQLVDDWVRHPHAVLHVTNLLQAVHRYELEYCVPNLLGRLQFGMSCACNRIQDLGSRAKGVGFREQGEGCWI